MSSSAAQQQKQQRVEIDAILSSNPVDIAKLKDLARVNNGFLSNTLRARVWPKLLGVNRYHIPDYKRYVKVIQFMQNYSEELSFNILICLLFFMVTRRFIAMQHNCGATLTAPSGV